MADNFQFTSLPLISQVSIDPPYAVKVIHNGNSHAIRNIDQEATMVIEARESDTLVSLSQKGMIVAKAVLIPPSASFSGIHPLE